MAILSIVQKSESIILCKANLGDSHWGQVSEPYNMLNGTKQYM